MILLFVNMFCLCLVDSEDTEAANAMGQLCFDVKIKRKVSGLLKAMC